MSETRWAIHGLDTSRSTITIGLFIQVRRVFFLMPIYEMTSCLIRVILKLITLQKFPLHLYCLVGTLTSVINSHNHHISLKISIIRNTFILEKENRESEWHGRKISPTGPCLPPRNGRAQSTEGERGERKNGNTWKEQGRRNPIELRLPCFRCAEKRRSVLATVVLVGHGQLLSALRTTRGQHSATVGRRHSFTETVLVLSLSVRGLIRSFHCFMFFLCYCSSRGFGLQK